MNIRFESSTPKEKKKKKKNSPKRRKAVAQKELDPPIPVYIDGKVHTYIDCETPTRRVRVVKNQVEQREREKRERGSSMRGGGWQLQRTPLAAPSILHLHSLFWFGGVHDNNTRLLSPIAVR